MTKRQTTEKSSVPSISPKERAEMKRSGGSASHSWNKEIVSRTLATAYAAGSLDVDLMDCNKPTIATAENTRITLAAFAPADEIEAMLAAQAFGLHSATMESLRRAAHPGEGSDGAGEQWTRAADLSRAMIESVEALDRRRASAPPSPPAPQPDAATGTAWRAPPMYPPTVPRAVDPGITADNVISRTGPGHGYRGGYGKVEPAW